MRNMKHIENERQIFTGTFVRFGEKTGYKGPVSTVLLKDIYDNKEKLLTDHLWFNLTKGFDKLRMKEGDIIEFYARVKRYEKGYRGQRDDVYVPHEMDYKLSHPSKLRKITVVLNSKLLKF